MDTKALNDAFTQVQQQLATADQNWQTAEEKLNGFLQQIENRLKDVQKKLQEVNQKRQEYQTKLDHTLQTLEQEVTKNNGVIASLSPGNSLAKKEQVAQKRVALLQALKQLEQSIGQADQELGTVLGELQQGAHQAQKDVQPVHTSLHDLATGLSGLGGRIQALAEQHAASSPPVLPAPEPSGVDTQVLASLRGAQTALLSAQQGLERARLLNNVLANIEEFARRYGLS